MEGWIKIHRRILSWEWYNDNNVKVLFLHLLLKANHEDKEWNGITIKRGQLLTSVSRLAKETHLSVRQTRRHTRETKNDKRNSNQNDKPLFSYNY